MKQQVYDNFELGPFRPPWELESIVKPGDIIEIDMVLFSKFAVYIGGEDGQMVYVTDPESVESSLASSSPESISATNDQQQQQQQQNVLDNSNELPPAQCEYHQRQHSNIHATNRYRTNSDSSAVKRVSANPRQHQQAHQNNDSSSIHSLATGLNNDCQAPSATLASVSPYSARKFAALHDMGLWSHRKSEPTATGITTVMMAKDDSSMLQERRISSNQTGNLHTRRFSSFRRTKGVAKIVIPDTPITPLNHEELKQANLLTTCAVDHCCERSDCSDSLDNELANVLGAQHDQHSYYQHHHHQHTASHHRHDASLGLMVIGAYDDDDLSSFASDSIRSSRSSLTTACVNETNNNNNNSSPSHQPISKSAKKKLANDDLLPAVANSSWSLNLIGCTRSCKKQQSATPTPRSGSPTLVNQSINETSIPTKNDELVNNQQTKHHELSRKYASIWASQRGRASSTSALSNSTVVAGSMSPPRLSLTSIPSGLKCIVQCGSLRQVAANYNCRINNKLPGASQRNLEPLPSEEVVKRCCAMIGQSLDFHIARFNSEYYATKWKFGYGWSDQASIMKRAVSSLQHYNRQPLTDTKSHQMLVNNLNAVINNPGIHTPPAPISPPMSY